MQTLATIGYENTTVADFLETLKDAGVELSVEGDGIYVTP